MVLAGGSNVAALCTLLTRAREFAHPQEPRRLQALDRRRNKEEKELRDRLCVFARFMTPDEFEKFFQGMISMFAGFGCCVCTLGAF